MIIGIGADIIHIHRVEKTVARFGARFVQRVFTPAEQAVINRRAEANGVYGAASLATMAKRFAVKEAVAKALGTGIGPKGVRFQHISLETGGQAPQVVLSGAAKDVFAQLVQAKGGGDGVVHVTVTDDPPIAQAFVVLEVLARQ
jgi:holo-[acyl-carrier protein] synthase